MSLRNWILRTSLTAVLVLTVMAVQAEGAFKAKLIGIDYHPTPSWQRWHHDATDLRDVMLTWGNWTAANIDLMASNATAGDINANLASTVLGANDVYLFFYSGHGSWTNLPPPIDNNEVVPKPPCAVDSCDEMLAPFGGSEKWDDDIANAFLNFPASAIKIVVLDCCFSGGFWGGCDEGDLEKVSNISLGASVPEDWYSPASSAWARALIAGATKAPNGSAPADLNGDGAITLAEWFSYAQSQVPTGEVYTNRKQPAVKICSQPDDEGYEILEYCITAPDIYHNQELDPNQIVVFYDTGTIPTLTEWGMIVFCVLLFGFMGWMIVRKRRSLEIRA